MAETGLADDRNYRRISCLSSKAFFSGRKRGTNFPYEFSSYGERRIFPPFSGQRRVSKGKERPGKKKGEIYPYFFSLPPFLSFLSPSSKIAKKNVDFFSLPPPEIPLFSLSRLFEPRGASFNPNSTFTLPTACPRRSYSIHIQAPRSPRGLRSATYRLTPIWITARHGAQTLLNSNLREPFGRGEEKEDQHHDSTGWGKWRGKEFSSTRRGLMYALDYMRIFAYMRKIIQAWPGASTKRNGNVCM